jgi:hypothetical protein
MSQIYSGEKKGRTMNPLTQRLKVFLVALFVAAAIATFLFAGSVGSKTDVVNVADAQLPPGSIMTVGTAHSHIVTSRPLSGMDTCPAVLGPAAPAPKREPSGNFLSGPIVSFEGLRHAELQDGNFCSCTTCPTDASGAVGFDYYVQTVNYAIAVYDKSGNLLAGPVSGTTFWEEQPDCGGEFYWSDAVVRFDRYANRWVISRPGGIPYGQDLCVAVSQTSDPTGRYDQYAFEVNNTTNGLFGFFDDYPKIAVFTDAYYATADPNKIFSGVGNTISAFERAAMLAGNPTPQFVTFFVPAPRNPPSIITHSHMLAAELDGTRMPPRNTPEYIVQVQDSHLGFPADRLQVYEFHVDWNSPTSSTFVPTQSLAPQPFNSNVCPIATDFQACLEQPGTPTLLDPLAYGYMMQRLTYRTFGRHQTLLFNHTVAADGDPSHHHAGIRWYELRMRTQAQTRGPWEIYQQGHYVPDANNRWLGSMAMDRVGNIAIGFSVSGSSVFPSIHYAGRRPGDPLGTLPSGELSLIEGDGVLDQTYYGDYSQMTIDPADDCTFWYTGTYIPTTSMPNDWHTRIASFRFSTCPGRN